MSGNCCADSDCSNGFACTNNQCSTSRCADGTQLVCGGRCITCRDPANGRAECREGTCQIASCNSGYTMACGQTCIPLGTCNALVPAMPDQCRSYTACDVDSPVDSFCDSGVFARTSRAGTLSDLRTRCETEFRTLAISLGVAGLVIFAFCARSVLRNLPSAPRAAGDGQEDLAATVSA